MFFYLFCRIFRVERVGRFQQRTVLREKRGLSRRRMGAQADCKVYKVCAFRQRLSCTRVTTWTSVSRDRNFLRTIARAPFSVFPTTRCPSSRSGRRWVYAPRLRSVLLYHFQRLFFKPIPAFLDDSLGRATNTIVFHKRREIRFTESDCFGVPDRVLYVRVSRYFLQIWHTPFCWFPNVFLFVLSHFSCRTSWTFPAANRITRKKGTLPSPNGRAGRL